MNNRGLQLLEDLKNVPNFDVTVLEQDLDAVNHKWESSSEVHSHTKNVDWFFAKTTVYQISFVIYKCVNEINFIVFSYSNFGNS